MQTNYNFYKEFKVIYNYPSNFTLEDIKGSKGKKFRSFCRLTKNNRTVVSKKHFPILFNQN